MKPPSMYDLATWSDAQFDAYLRMGGQVAPELAGIAQQRWQNIYQSKPPAPGAKTPTAPRKAATKKKATRKRAWWQII